MKKLSFYFQNIRGWGSSLLLLFMLLLNSCSGGSPGGDGGDGGDGGGGIEVPSIGYMSFGMLEADMKVSTPSITANFRMEESAFPANMDTMFFQLNKVDVEATPRAIDSAKITITKVALNPKQAVSHRKARVSKASVHASAGNSTQARRTALEKRNPDRDSSISKDIIAARDIDCTADCNATDISALVASLPAGGNTAITPIKFAAGFLEMFHQYDVQVSLTSGSKTVTLEGSFAFKEPSAGFKVFTIDVYEYLVTNTKDNPTCSDISLPANSGLTPPTDSNGVALPNPRWYYTFENFVEAMQIFPDFLNSSDPKLQAVELAAFFAHVAQETGINPSSPEPNGMGCAVTESFGAWWGNPQYTSQEFLTTHPDANAPAGYFGRGPHQLTWNYNYFNFSEYCHTNNISPDCASADSVLKDPDLLYKNPVLGIVGSLWYWNQSSPYGNEAELVSLGIPYTPAPHEVITGTWQPTDADIKAGRTLDKRFGVTTNIINGSLECRGAGGVLPQNTTGALNRSNAFFTLLNLLGVSPSDLQSLGILNTKEDQDCKTNQYNFNACFSAAGIVPAYPQKPDCIIANEGTPKKRD